MAKKKTAVKRAGNKKPAPKQSGKPVALKKNTSKGKKPAKKTLKKVAAKPVRTKAKATAKEAAGKKLRSASAVRKAPAKSSAVMKKARPLAKAAPIKSKTERSADKKPKAVAVPVSVPKQESKKTVPTAPVAVSKATVAERSAPSKPAVSAPPAKSTAPAPQARPVEPKKPLKERVVMEFEVRSAPNVLFDLISTPSGFSEWYCDDVNVRDDQYTFIWNGEEEATTMIGRRLGEVIRFHRNDDPDEASFFEFRIRIDAMTNEVALIVTDHAWPNEIEETRNLWASQVASLLRVLGA